MIKECLLAVVKTGRVEIIAQLVYDVVTHADKAAFKTQRIRGTRETWRAWTLDATRLTLYGQALTSSNITDYHSNR